MGALSSRRRPTRPWTRTRRADAAGAAAGEGPAAFPEGTQALLDRLERLADMRDRGPAHARRVRDRQGGRDARAGGPVVTVPRRLVPGPRARRR